MSDRGKAVVGLRVKDRRWGVDRHPQDIRGYVTGESSAMKVSLDLDPPNARKRQKRGGRCALAGHVLLLTESLFALALLNPL